MRVEEVTDVLILQSEEPESPAWDWAWSPWDECWDVDTAAGWQVFAGADIQNGRVPDVTDEELDEMVERIEAAGGQVEMLSCPDRIDGETYVYAVRLDSLPAALAQELKEKWELKS